MNSSGVALTSHPGTRPRALVAFALVVASLGARADVWGYLDEKGTTHFATEKVDERYELFFRGAFDTARDRAQPTAAPTAPAADVPAAAPHLLAFFDVSPGFRQVQHLLREAAQAQGLDHELLKALIATESGFDARAISPKGAIGLMQVMPATAERWGLQGDARMPLEARLAEPRTNIRIGTRHLRHLMNLYAGQLELVLAAYNAGEGAVRKAGNRIPDFAETRNYVKTVLQIYASLKPQVVAATPVRPAASGRVRMELPGAGEALRGGARGRGNMPPSFLQQQPATDLQVANSNDND